MPDMFVDCGYSEIPLIESLVNRLVKEEPASPDGIPLSFWDAICDRFEGDGLEDIVDIVLTELGHQMAKETIFSQFRTFYRVLGEFSQHKRLALAMTQAPSWLPPDTDAPHLPSQTLLGPFFNLSAFPQEVPSVITTYFNNIRERSRSDIDSCVGSLRGTNDGVFTTLFQFTNALIRTGAEPKSRVLGYIAHVVNFNAARGKMQVDRRTVSPDGFILNWSAVLLRLCEPFLDRQFSKVARIDDHYFAKSELVHIRELTRIHASEDDAIEYLRQSPPTPGPANFISDMFFLTFAMQHIGLLHNLSDYQSLARELVEFQRHMNRLKEQREAWLNTPAATLNEPAYQRHVAHFDRMLASKMALETQVLNPSLLAGSVQFYSMAMAWLLRLIDPQHQYPHQPLPVDLPAQAPSTLATLPEYYIEDATDFFVFLMKFDPRCASLISPALPTLITFAIVFLGQSGYVKNPYLRAKLVEVLYFLTLDQGALDPNGMLLTDGMAIRGLAPALMRFYVEVEQTGASSQFYDKFNIRYNISQVLKHIRQSPDHRQRIQDMSQDTEFFIKFVNLIMNDATYLLDESLTTLTEIRNIQNEMAQEAEWQAQPDTYRSEREALLQQDERKAQSYVALGNDTVEMLTYLTKEVSQPFVSAEIVDRLAAMLNYNLQGMVGPKCTELKVKNPEKYQFQPRLLLSDIIAIYLHLADYPEFVQAVARDGRSYNQKWFLKAIHILDRYALKSATELARLQRLLHQVEEKVQANANAEEDLGDIPDEFLDPLMYTLMTDPVVLPTSNVTVDRSTIKSHLLSDGTDPFNRKPLTIDMVVPNEELKAKIEAFIQSKQ
ncbi:ubiquitin elongating factor core-domain-containing protein [Dimargaris cristalligena]|uniref:RING-type E3 ubiquitin transferase n=1 Tax=Dimargaris cristalligena TaxID=215637 RepID=A0A4P9ZUG1_9FUNG|nr:ubiquitin elongating factor core-domain-containing protein [Dimargaris cristalligena]|eukprot:RKP37177.1 ubiquitin elongating factor core-domain-containing protein [Dimargaris cristalligena]